MLLSSIITHRNRLYQGILIGIIFSSFARYSGSLIISYFNWIDLFVFYVFVFSDPNGHWKSL